MVAPEALLECADKIPQGSRADFFEFRGALWKILLRPISVRTCQIVEEHSWQNLPIFRQEPKCVSGIRTLCRGQGLNLPCGEKIKTVLIISSPLKFRTFELVQKNFRKILKGFWFLSNIIIVFLNTFYLIDLFLNVPRPIGK